MKSLFTLIFCFASLFYTLDAQVQIVKDSLSISKTVGYQQKVDFKDYEIKFKSVITDSRCPKNVMCVRAGEADVLVSIYKNGKFIEDKKIRIDASGYVMESNNLAFSAKDFKIYGFALTPYPGDANDIADKDYQLEIVLKYKTLN
ncbi:hypothetical protein FBALC1_00817 [Flavobacteriales bacterium ALC-1]|nr:hypothetical protein FBALC1_00817 [Flavobacteriales bacterium ALC-1]